MQFCNQCGAQMNDGAKFCPKCGATIGQPQAPQYSQPNNDQSFNAPGFNPAPNNYQQQTQVPPQQQVYGQVPPPQQQPPVYGQNTQIPPYQAPKTGNFFKDILNTPDYTAQYDPADIANSKGITIASYFWILFWLPLAVNSNSRYGRFHANQALLMLIASAACSLVSWILNLIIGAIFVVKNTVGNAFMTGNYSEYVTSGFGLFLSGLFGFILAIPSLAFLILGIINAANGKAKELPIIGKFRIIK
ncbi:zinc-ribbon domain-containing protein [Pseudoruminococcus massiliensis]|uniref:zinc-ribbon domain-containing protein n=1 Tax=Pseudoruminococcus massiliensis TaxID=2086583 RepID=UPI0039A090E9